MHNIKGIHDILRSQGGAPVKTETALKQILLAALENVGLDHGSIQLEMQTGTEGPLKKSIEIEVIRKDKRSSGVAKQKKDLDAVPPLPHRDTIIVPISYQNEQIGEILVSKEGKIRAFDKVFSFFKHFAQELTYFVKRREIREQSRMYQGKEDLWVGYHSSLREVEKFVEKASTVDFPVMIVGEQGTEKTLLARSIHLQGKREKGPFVEVRCASLSSLDIRRTIAQLIEQAKGGTLFFNGIDQLNAEALECILEHWDYFMPSGALSSVPVWLRVIVSVTRDTPSLVNANDNSWLDFDFLRVFLPPLRLRGQDIRDWFQYFMEKYSPQRTIQFRKEIMDVLESYLWPENIKELERVVVRLISLVDSEMIELSDLYALAPELMENWRSPEQPEDTLSVLSMNTVGKSALEEPGGSILPADQIAKNLADGKLVDLEGTHPNLSTTLGYLRDHFNEDITLGELASKAYVSPSHLSHLLKTTLGKSFKQFHTQIRVERAKVLLGENPLMKVTEISLEVGYGDLSHFEKTFKRIVGMSPKNYRQMVQC